VYAPSFFVAGPTGSMTFANDAQFLDWLAQVRTFNREHGMRALSPAAVPETLLSPLHVLAQVRWSARFERTGTRAIEPPGLAQLGRLHYGLLVQQYRQHFKTSHKNNAAVPACAQVHSPDAAVAIPSRDGFNNSECTSS
jgi:hypothetical protein